MRYEGSLTDGSFENPLRYSRDNLTANLTRRVSAATTYGFRFNGASNDFYSSGQLPLDMVVAGQLDRFGYIDPTDGGHVRTGTLGAYFCHEGAHGEGTWRLDAFAARSLFDLYLNFTFFLNNPVSGDGSNSTIYGCKKAPNYNMSGRKTLSAAQGLLTMGGNNRTTKLSRVVSEGWARAHRSDYAGQCALDRRRRIPTGKL